MSVHALVRTQLPYVVLAAVDRSDEGLGAIDWVIARARAESSWVVHFVHVTPTQWTGLDEFQRRSTSRQDLMPVMERLSRARDRTLLGRMHFHQAAGERTSNVIVRLASEVDADLVVVGAERRSSFGASETDRVVGLAGCPVIVVRAKNHPRSLQRTH
jgi:nucleotide-binding universal stress UspA family protein